VVVVGDVVVGSVRVGSVVVVGFVNRKNLQEEEEETREGWIVKASDIGRRIKTGIRRGVEWYISSGCRNCLNLCLQEDETLQRIDSWGPWPD